MVLDRPSYVALVVEEVDHERDCSRIIATIVLDVAVSVSRLELDDAAFSSLFSISSRSHDKV